MDMFAPQIGSHLQHDLVLESVGDLQLLQKGMVVAVNGLIAGQSSRQRQQRGRNGPIHQMGGQERPEIIVGPIDQEDATTAEGGVKGGQNPLDAIPGSTTGHGRSTSPNQVPGIGLTTMLLVELNIVLHKVGEYRLFLNLLLLDYSNCCWWCCFWRFDGWSCDCGSVWVGLWLLEQQQRWSLVLS